MDADHSGDSETGKSTTGYLVYLAEASVIWSSKLQSIVAQSSAESEYIALVAVCNEIKWLVMLFSELNIRVTLPVKVYMDNTSAKALAENPGQHQRSKHINLKYHVVRDYVKKGLVHLEYVPSEENIADLLTKSLAEAAFHRCASRMVTLVPEDKAEKKKK